MFSDFTKQSGDLLEYFFLLFFPFLEEARPQVETEKQSGDLLEYFFLSPNAQKAALVEKVL